MRQFDSLEVSELFCPRCGRATPVRQHLLLVLPTGNRYEYRCSRCSTPVGEKMDESSQDFARTLTGGPPGRR